MQCAHDPDPNLRSEDTAGDALWSMGQRFEAEHEEKAARETYAYLVDQYPSSRHAEAARAAITALGGAPLTTTNDAGASP
ncbi:MAG: hypothetical protein ABI551_03415 [Polyangiaceae bacterium]